MVYTLMNEAIIDGILHKPFTQYSHMISVNTSRDIDAYIVCHIVVHVIGMHGFHHALTVLTLM